MKDAYARAAAGNDHFGHFGPDANLLDELEELFRGYGEMGYRPVPGSTSMMNRRPSSSVAHLALSPTTSICPREHTDRWPRGSALPCRPSR